MPWKEDHLDSSCLTRQKKWGTKQHEVTDKKWCIQAATSCLWYQAKWRKNWLVAITVVGVDRDFQNGFILGKRILVHKYIVLVMGRALKNRSRADPEPWISISSQARAQALHKSSIPSLDGPVFLLHRSPNFLGPSPKINPEPGSSLSPSQKFEPDP